MAERFCKRPRAERRERGRVGWDRLADRIRCARGQKDAGLFCGDADRNMRPVIAIGVDPLFDFVAEVANKSLHGPGGGVAKRANRMALNLTGDVEQFVDFRRR